MSESVVRPYEPLTCTVGLQNFSTYEVTQGVAGELQILAPDPGRLYALLFFAGSNCQLSPFPNQSVYNLDNTNAAPGKSILLHSASYPGLVQRAWYGRWAAAGSVMVVDVSARG